MTPTAAKRVALEDSAKTEIVGGDVCPFSCGVSATFAMMFVHFCLAAGKSYG